MTAPRSHLSPVQRTSHPQPCEHLAGEPTLHTELVLDAYLDLVDGFVRCAGCNQHYLLELVDLDADTRLYRVSLSDAAAVAATVRSINKGSCDLERARAEVLNLTTRSQPIEALLVKQRGRFQGLVPLAPEITLPATSWRERPHTGDVIAALLRPADTRGS